MAIGVTAKLSEQSSVPAVDENIIEDGEIEDDDSSSLDLGFTDKDILAQIEPQKRKALKHMTEMQREKEILKLIDEAEAEKKREVLRKRISSQESANMSSQDSLHVSKQSKWATEADLADLEALKEEKVTLSPRKINIKSKNNADIPHNHISETKTFSAETKEDDAFSDSKPKGLSQERKLITSVEDLKKIRISRAKLVKSLYMPYFLKLALVAW